MVQEKDIETSIFNERGREPTKELKRERELTQFPSGLITQQDLDPCPKNFPAQVLLVFF